MQCSNVNCRKTIPDTIAHCPYCGTLVSKMTSTLPTPPPPPARALSPLMLAFAGLGVVIVLLIAILIVILSGTGAPKIAQATATPAIAPTRAPTQAPIVVTATRAPTTFVPPTAVIVVVTATPAPPTRTPAPTNIPPNVPVKRVNYLLSPDGEVLEVEDLIAGGKTRVFGGANIQSAAWSPDGKSLIVAFGGQEGNYLKRYLRFVYPGGGSTKDVWVASFPFAPSRVNFGYSNTLWTLDGKRFLSRYIAEERGIVALNADGSGSSQTLKSSVGVPDGAVGFDFPRFITADGKFIVTITVNSFALTAYEIDGARRVPLSDLGAVKLLDQRYYPWKLIDPPACKSHEFWTC